MKNMFRNLWNDDAGFIVSGEIVFLFTITVIGLIVGWVHVRNAVASELTDIANAIQAVNQSYVWYGLQNPTCTNASVAGSQLTDPAVVQLNLSELAPVTPVSSPVDACILAP